MFLALLLIWTLIADGADTGAPQYTADSVVNPVAGVAGMYAPNSFITIYGTQLSYVTRAMGPDDLRAGMLPTVLLGTSVRVAINHIPADIYYVSPTQVNVLVPASLSAGPAVFNWSMTGSAARPSISCLAPSRRPYFRSAARWR
jgi:uncharacterized protein (TIGR03437 family)